MTTKTLTRKSCEGRAAVAVELLALSAAAIGLGLSLLVATGDTQAYAHEPAELGIGSWH